jgi:hypothetical protein
LISVAGSLIKESVICRIKLAKFWALWADETTDRQKREQLVVIRPVQQDSNGKWFCFEDPVAVVDIYSLIKGDKSTKDGEIRLSGIAIGEVLLRVVRDDRDSDVSKTVRPTFVTCMEALRKTRRKIHFLGIDVPRSFLDQNVSYTGNY